MPLSASNSTDYINSVDYTTLTPKLTQLNTIIDDLTSKVEATRKLRYAEVDIEAERESGRFAPDELYIPLHIIDTNIRREQSPYVQYITQSPRAVILRDLDDNTVDLSILETDLTDKIRYEGWQLPMFANIDGMQANGYGVMEVIQDQSKPGEVAAEYVQYGDFAFISDVRDVQTVELCGRAYYYNRTQLTNLVQKAGWNADQVEKIIAQEPEGNRNVEATDYKDRSLYKVIKFMFKVNGIVQVAWGHPEKCDNWLRDPRPLFLGRRQLQPNLSPIQKIMAKAGVLPKEKMYPEAFETEYPYVMFPYLISENDTISQLKGRVFLDQDLQEATTSLLSSTCTQARRAAGLYFSKETSDPNDDILMQKNIYFRQGALINSAVKSFSLPAPDPGMFSAINMLMTVNQAETSQVSFATNNRKDSRKTAAEINVAERQETQLSTVQVVLFSIALSQLYRKQTDVIRSRVLSGLIQIQNQQLLQQYQRRFVVKPAGDVDVIQKQQLIQKMMNAWPVVQNTPMNEIFLIDLLQLMFPERVAKYQAVLAQSKQQQNSQQQQQLQQFFALAKQLADGIVTLSKHPDFFSDVGKLHALPIVKMTADRIEELTQQATQQNGNSPRQIPNSV